ncbi:MAG: hypothetical protein HKL90_14335 [Elusimicrobia bacterium]|nr:hypothetical protein [Elusimicrobiota bacterium]
MMNRRSIVLAALALAAFAAACHDPKPAAPNYGATLQDANKAQNTLDNSNGN